jgi:hypothetical protein
MGTDWMTGHTCICYILKIYICNYDEKTVL